MGEQRSISMQMQVTVPAGVGPGTPFLVNTPSGQMQVTCPLNASAGSQMIVNVPMAQSPPADVPMGVPAMQMGQPMMAQPMMAQLMMAQPVMAQSQGAVVMGTVMPMAAAQTGAPQPQGMARGPMDGRVEEIQMGWYTQKGAPCCYFMQHTFNSDRTVISSGPGCFCCLCCGCCPGCCGKYKLEAPGTATFRAGKSEMMTWQSPTSYTLTGGMANGDTYDRCC